MVKNIFAGATYFFLLSALPAAAQLTTLARHKVPAPDADVGVVSLVMVAAAVCLTYWRKHRS